MLAANVAALARLYEQGQALAAREMRELPEMAQVGTFMVGRGAGLLCMAWMERNVQGARGAEEHMPLLRHCRPCQH